MRFSFFLAPVFITNISFAMEKLPSTDDSKDIQSLVDTAQWIFDQGYPLYRSYKGYHENSEKHWEYIHKIIDKYNVHSHAIEPDSGFPAAPLQLMFSIHKGRFALSLECYQRKISETGEVYEIWHKKLYCRGFCKDQEKFSALVTVRPPQA